MVWSDLSSYTLWLIIFQAYHLKCREAPVSFKALDFTSQFSVELWGLKELDHVRNTVPDKGAASLTVCETSCSVTSLPGLSNQITPASKDVWNFESALWFFHPLCREVLQNPLTALAKPRLTCREQTTLKYSFLTPLNSSSVKSHNNNNSEIVLWSLACLKLRCSGRASADEIISATSNIRQTL